MRTSTLLTALTSSSLASARIIGLAAPATLTPNASFTLTLLTENYIQSVADVAVAWGFQTPTENNPTGFPYTLGSFANSAYLGPEKSNTLQNVTIDATAPATLEKGKDVVLGVAVMSLYGASGGPITQAWNVTVHVGEEASGDLVASREVGWRENGDC
ncbi:hypothetical protein IQ06DRAFT_290651 [Phaeosphaeriaceae sp. SRC1lsM3a]|nr:hypothetical protein IQ06DRAFT_290651 [Stagonospora sp. SRC1lsM3a]